MREAFAFVRGAVSSKDLVPVLTHFAIHSGHIYGFNGRVFLCAPAPELANLPSLTVPASPMMSAIDACDGEPRLVVEGEVLKVSDATGDFSASIPTGPIERFPLVEKAGKRKAMKGAFLSLLKDLRPFVGADASRPWCMSIKFVGNTAYATNNVVLASAPLPDKTQAMTCALPVFAIDELLRIGEEPSHLAFDGENAVIFYLAGGRWMRSVLIEDAWPDASAALKTASAGAKYSPVPPGLLEAVRKVKPFCPDPKYPIVRLVEHSVSTQDGAMSAKVAGFKALGNGSFHVDPLLSVLEAARQADWGRAPRVPWRGDRGLNGVLLGLAL